MMMQTGAQSWEDLRRAARTAERHLEDKIATYTAISKAAARVATDYDVENPPADTTGEHQLALDIENTLTTLSDTIDEMSTFVSTSSVKTHEALLQRYRELYFDFKTEFRRSMSALQEKRDSQKLFGNRQKNGNSDDVEMDSLLNERRALDSSRSMTNSIIEQALETKNSLDSQRSRFTNSRSKMNTLSNSFAGINSIVAQIRRKKLRNNTILALVVAGCVCFTLWWTVLSKTKTERGGGKERESEPTKKQKAAQADASSSRRARRKQQLITSQAIRKNESMGDRSDRGERGDRSGISLLIRNVSRRLRAEDIRKEFERFGDVRDVYIPRDFYTREPKGFAFVEFKTERDANDARAGLDGVRIDGREVRVVFAQERRKTTDQMRDREKERKSSRSRSPSRGRGRRGGAANRSRSRDRRPARRNSRSRSPAVKSRSGSRGRSPARGRSRSPRRSPARSPRHSSPGARSPEPRSPGARSVSRSPSRPKDTRERSYSPAPRRDQRSPSGSPRGDRMDDRDD